jgi:glutathione S-transferase
MALLVSGVSFSAFEIILRNRPAEMLAVSPKGTVPVLQLPDGRILEQSWDIVRWAMAPCDVKGWWSRAQTHQNVELLECNDTAFKRSLDRYKYPERFPEANRAVHREQAVTEMLLPLEERLQIEPFLGGSMPCATDIGVLPFVRQFAAVEPEWFSQQHLPALRDWLKHWMSSGLFAACMVKLPVHAIAPFPLFNGYVKK